MKIIENKLFNTLSIALICLLSIFYIVFEYIYFKFYGDYLFIILLCFATVFLVYKFRSLSSFFINNSYYENLVEKKEYINSLQEDYDYIFNFKYTFMIGMIYSVLFFLVILKLDVMVANNLHKFIFSFYLGVMNFFTGIAIVLSVRSFYILKKYCKLMEKSIFENKSIHYIKKLKFKVSLLMIFYSGLSLTSTIFSPIKLGNVMILYVTGSILFVGGYYVFFEYKITSFLNNEKYRIMDSINSSIYNSYLNSINSIKSKNFEYFEKEIKKIENYIYLKEKLSAFTKAKIKYEKIYEFISLVIIAVIPIFVQAFIN